MERVKRGDINKKREKWRLMPSAPKQLLVKLLKLDSIERLTACEALRDPWFEGILNVAKQSTVARITEGLTRFTALNDIQQQNWVALAIQLPEWDYGRQMFEAIDGDQDGVLGHDDLVSMGFPNELKAWFSYSEFIASLLMAMPVDNRSKLVSGTLPFAFESIKSWDSTIPDYKQYTKLILHDQSLKN